MTVSNDEVRGRRRVWFRQAAIWRNTMTTDRLGRQPRQFSHRIFRSTTASCMFTDAVSVYVTSWPSQEYTCFTSFFVDGRLCAGKCCHLCTSLLWSCTRFQLAVIQETIEGIQWDAGIEHLLTHLRVDISVAWSMNYFRQRFQFNFITCYTAAGRKYINNK